MLVASAIWNFGSWGEKAVKNVILVSRKQYIHLTGTMCRLELWQSLHRNLITFWFLRPRPADFRGFYEWKYFHIAASLFRTYQQWSSLVGISRTLDPGHWSDYCNSAGTRWTPIHWLLASGALGWITGRYGHDSNLKVKIDPRSLIVKRFKRISSRYDD